MRIELYAVIDAISLGEFETTFLKHYEHPDQLADACKSAIDELADEPYTDYASEARLMGRAMELLREQYDLNAPRGWVPVLKSLRSLAAAGRPKSEDNNKYLPRPERMLDQAGSVLCVLDDVDLNGELGKQAQENRELHDALIATAKETGVPFGHRDALPFIQRVIAKFDSAPLVLVKARDVLEERVRDLPVEQKVSRKTIGSVIEERLTKKIVGWGV